MKKIKNIKSRALKTWIKLSNKAGLLMLFVIFSAFLSSCKKDFLEITPIDRVAKDNFFKTDNDLVLATNGVYAAQRGIYTLADGSGRTFFVMQECRSDNALQDVNDQAERIAVDKFNESAGNLVPLGVWGGFYNTINLANAVIERGPGITAGDQVLVKRLMAEAKFIRASCYFQLVKLWGGVPLQLNETIDFSKTIKPRASVAETYAQIIKDLTEAKAGLPASYSNAANNEKGRATSWAASAMLGKVYLQKGDKAAAITELKSIVTTGPYSLLPNYADLWKAGNYNHAESIYEISFGQANNTGSPYTRALLPNAAMSALGINAGGNDRPNRPTQDMINAYEVGDLRKAISMGTAGGLTYIAKYIDPTVTNSLGSRNSWLVIRYADVLLSLAEALGEGAEAYGYINQVRTRAGLASINAGSPGTFSQKVQQERRVELAFEGHRWYDLLRLPEAEVLGIMNPKITAEFGAQYVINKNHLLYLIPGVEVDASGGVVTQNPR